MASETLPIPGGTIRYNGLFDFDGLYFAISEWFKKYRYWFHETSYKHKVPNPRGAEQELDVHGELEITDFIKFNISLNIRTWDMTEVEIVKNGQKKLLTKARLQVKLFGKIEYDWQNKFTKNAFTRALFRLYYAVFYRKEMTSIWGDMLVYRMFNLHHHIKKYIDMQTQYNAYEGYLGENR